VINFDVLGLGAGGIDQLFISGAFGLAGATAGLASSQALESIGLGGTVAFNLMDVLTFEEFAESFSIFDFFLGGTPDAPTVLSDITLFSDLMFTGMDATGAFDLFVTPDGGFTETPLPNADLNDDGFVTVIDFLILRSLLNTTDPLADLNGDGFVTVIDFLILRSLLNTAAPFSSQNAASLSANPIPLPAALPLFSAGLALLGWLRRKTA